jgi:hypothetical protein
LDRAVRHHCSGSGAGRLHIEIDMDRVTFDGLSLERPDHWSRSYWLAFWEHVRDSAEDMSDYWVE